MDISALLETLFVAIALALAALGGSSRRTYAGSRRKDSGFSGALHCASAGRLASATQSTWSALRARNFASPVT